MDFTIQSDADGVFILSAPEPVDWREQEGLADLVVDAVGAGPISGLVVDLYNVKYISSSGLGSIFVLRKTAMGLGAAIVLARPNPTILRLLKTVQVPDLMPVLDDLEQAKATAKAGPTA